MNKFNKAYKQFQDKKKKELQDLLDKNAFSDKPNPGKTNEENFWIKIISFILLFACGFSALIGRILGKYAVYIQYLTGGVFIILILGLIVFFITNKKKE